MFSKHHAPHFRNQIDCLRCGISRVEVVSLVGVTTLVLTMCLPLVQSIREQARAIQCRQNLIRLGIAFGSYHDVNTSFPAAAVWQQGPLSSLALHTTKRIDLITYDNWALNLLPHLASQELYHRWNRERPIADPANATLRLALPSIYRCPTDEMNRADNPYEFLAGTASPNGSRSVISFSRGNYGINGGSHNSRADSGSTAAPQGDHSTLILNEEDGTFRYLGSGVGGINWSLRKEEFVNGQSTLIMVDELRAGILPADPRGVWALGQIGGSITWAHGINGDAFAPNHPWERADDILGCWELHRLVGSEGLIENGMPCVNYIDANQQAAARSQHAGGVHSLFADGNVQFISNGIDPGVWHVLHSRETPSRILREGPDTLVKFKNESQDAFARPVKPWPSDTPQILQNSIGMRFCLIPAGEFTMGMADAGFGPEPAETPAHQVRISHDYYLGQTEVTRRDYEAVMPVENKNNGSTRSPAPLVSRVDLSLVKSSQPDSLQMPMTEVTWADAQRFCDRLSELAAEEKALRRYRLPTEAEWEYACRDRSTTPHSLPISASMTHGSGESAGVLPPANVGPVRRFPANSFGLYDMRGNVWEWCQDWFDRDYYSRSPSVNPQGPSRGFLKVVRGSDWIFVGEKCMINYPIMPPWKKSPFVGFRVICERAD